MENASWEEYDREGIIERVYCRVCSGEPILNNV